MDSYGDFCFPGFDFSADELIRFFGENPSLKKIWLYDRPQFDLICKQNGFAHSLRRNIPILDLDKSIDELWSDLSVSRRNGIRFAEKNGVIVERAVAEHAEAFKPVWVEGFCKKYEAETESAEVRIRDWINKGMLFIACVASTGQLIAGTNVREVDTRGEKEALMYSMNTSLIEFQRLKPNDLLLWEIIKWAKMNGYREFCMGGSNLFKNQFTKRYIPVDEWLRADVT